MLVIEIFHRNVFYQLYRSWPATQGSIRQPINATYTWSNKLKKLSIWTEPSSAAHHANKTLLSTIIGSTDHAMSLTDRPGFLTAESLDSGYSIWAQELPCEQMNLHTHCCCMLCCAEQNRAQTDWKLINVSKLNKTINKWNTWNIFIWFENPILAELAY